jgi:hypothetical protein
MDAIADMIARGWENFVARPGGPLNLRFIIQPLLAVGMALWAGIKDAKAGRPAYLWSALTDSAQRVALLRQGWKDMRTTFLMSATLDAVYQTIIRGAIYLFELLFTATLLALVPYFILRGPFNRIARIFVHPAETRSGPEPTGTTADAAPDAQRKEATRG